MTLTVKIDLSPEQEAQLRDGITHHDTERVQRILTDALAPAVETILNQGIGQSDEYEFETIADQLADMVAATVKENTPVLPDDAVSRAGIYEDHP